MRLHIRNYYRVNWII